MKTKTILKIIFIPFYGAYYFNKKGSDLDAPMGFYGVVLACYIIARLGYGISEANNPNGCIVRSIGDVIIAPMYTLGCNIGKDRFEYKVN